MAAEKHQGPNRFPVTQWSLVIKAGQLDPKAKREALGQLLPRYLPAMKAHLVHRKRLPSEKADDLLQEFVANKILEKDLIARADQQLGKFRTLMLTALDRFVKNQLRNEHAKKRAASDGAMLGLDEHADYLPGTARGAEEFDLAWARGVINEALRKMRQQCESSGRMQLWGIFECRVVGPTLHAAAPIDYAQLVERFGFQSPSQASNALTTAKRMYARALRDAVSEYARDEEEIEAEIKELREILAQCGA